MPKVIIDVQTSLEKEKQEIKQDLLWYDPVDRTMHKFQGTYLEYEFVEFPGLEVYIPNMGWIKGKTIASPKTQFRQSSKRVFNHTEVMKWVAANAEFGLQIESSDNREVVVSFNNPDDQSDIERSLYRARLRYEITND